MPTTPTYCIKRDNYGVRSISYRQDDRCFGLLGGSIARLEKKTPRPGCRFTCKIKALAFGCWGFNGHQTAASSRFTGNVLEYPMVQEVGACLRTVKNVGNRAGPGKGAGSGSFEVLAAHLLNGAHKHVELTVYLGTIRQRPHQTSSCTAF